MENSLKPLQYPLAEVLARFNYRWETDPKTGRPILRWDVEPKEKANTD